MTNSWSWHPFATFERNGMLNIGIPRLFSRIIYPGMAVFLIFYVGSPVVYGSLYSLYFNNWQHEAVYFKFTRNRHMFIDITYNKLA